MTQSTLPCPGCNASIPLNTFELLAGKPLTCPKCKAKISLGQSERDNAMDAFKKLNQLKGGND